MAAGFAALHAGIIVGTYIGAYTNVAGRRPNAGLFIEGIAGTGATEAEMPLLAMVTSGAGTKSNIAIELGYAGTTKTVTSGSSGNMLYHQTLHCVFNDVASYIPYSTVEGTYTTAYPIVTTYGAGTALDVTVSNAANGIGAIKITSTPTIDDGEYHVPIWVDAQLSKTGGGSIYGIRGHVGTAGGVTMDATGYQIGVHGRILNSGIVDNSGIIIAGLLGQTLTGGTYSACSHMACAWLSWQSTTVVSAGETEILYLSHNAAGLTLDSFIYVYGANAVNYFMKFANTMTGNWADTGTQEGEECIGHLKVRFNNQDGYINVFSDNS